MKSKDALEYIAKEKGIDNITQEIKENWKMYQPCFQTIDRDLDRLEKLEEFVSIIKEKLIIYKYDNIYDDSTFYFLETIDKNKELTEKQKDLVKEVLENVKN